MEIRSRENVYLMLGERNVKSVKYLDKKYYTFFANKIKKNIFNNKNNDYINKYFGRVNMLLFEKYNFNFRVQDLLNLNVDDNLLSFICTKNCSNSYIDEENNVILNIQLKNEEIKDYIYQFKKMLRMPNDLRYKSICNKVVEDNVKIFDKILNNDHELYRTMKHDIINTSNFNL